MAHVIATRRLAFHDDAGSHTVVPSEQPQLIPDRFLDHHYFKSAEESGWVKVVSKAQPEKEVDDKAEAAGETDEDPSDAQTESGAPTKANRKGKAKGKVDDKAEAAS